MRYGTVRRAGTQSTASGVNEALVLGRAGVREVSVDISSAAVCDILFRIRECTYVLYVLVKYRDNASVDN